MKQKVFTYQNKARFAYELAVFKKELSNDNYTNLFFQVYSSILRQDKLKEICDTLSSVFPDTEWVGNSTSSNLVNCDTADDIVITAHIFELPETKFKILQYDMAQISPSEITNEVLEEAACNPWVRAIELYWTITDFSTTELCEGLQDLNIDIHVFGGIVCNPDITNNDSCIFSSANGFCNTGVQFIFYGGDNFFVDSIKISGWKPIGRNFLVTKASGSRLYELGGIPAFEVYKKYLNIQNDDDFFYNTLDFPMMYEHNDTTIVRAPSFSYEDGSLALTSDVEVGEILRLSYGDPQTILSSIRQGSEHIRAFQPDVMHIFSCAARKAFWAPYKPNYEIQSLKGIAPVIGFCSHGEFIREKKYLNQHNITLVIGSMREGEKKNLVPDPSPHRSVSSGRLPLAARMATFIRETSYELEEINSTLEVMNHQLEGLASTDSLTGLKNRLAYNELMQQIARDTMVHNWVMLMMDVNGLKYTNDTFGHLAGDELIISAAKLISQVFGKRGHCFRIGGDEFAVVIDASVEEMRKLTKQFHQLVKEENTNNMYHLSIAIGESRLKDASNTNKSISDWKMDADLNMYRDKSLLHRRALEHPEVQNYKELINCLIMIEEAKDPYTAHHSDRVSDLSATIAKMLGLTDNTVQVIRDAAHLHDIGKVGISDSILLKPSALNNEEFERLKDHPVIGARILMQSNYTQELVQIVLHHHERYDGNGYPDRLLGPEIPIGARIVSLADSIDAMTSKRVYRNSMSLISCKNEIERNLGRMYDPAIGKMCLEHWDEIEAILLSHPKRLI